MLEKVDARTLQREAFRADVLEGLSRALKTLPSRWLYDDIGSELFEQITQLPEYYPTRAETEILRDNGSAIAAFCGAEATLIEYGAGAGVKTEIVLAALDRPKLYVPVDIAGDFLESSAARIARRFPGVAVRPVVADFTDAFNLPSDIAVSGARVGFFPGSTIGNLSSAQAASFLGLVGGHVGPEGRALIGIDLKKDLAVLLPAYDDAAGVTAAFDLNLLARANRELDGDFDLSGFAHEARWSESDSAVEMHLVSLREQTATVSGRAFRFAEGETIHTESSRKYDLASFGRLAARSGWEVATVWTDGAARFALVGLSRC